MLYHYSHHKRDSFYELSFLFYQHGFRPMQEDGEALLWGGMSFFQNHRSFSHSASPAARVIREKVHPQFASGKVQLHVAGGPEQGQRVAACMPPQRPRPRTCGSFDEDRGDCLYLQPILHHETHKPHTVELTILPTDAHDATAFYLVALIVAG